MNDYDYDIKMVSDAWGKEIYNKKRSTKLNIKCAR
jgi:hypothetical protein